MTKIDYIKKIAISSLFAGVLLVAGVIVGSAQNTNQQYRQWQDAQARAQRAQQDYMRTRSQRDYRQWQDAQARAQREYSDYVNAQNNNRYNNNGYNNGSYNNSGYTYNNNNSYGRYRVYRNGSYYETNSQGAALLKQAVQSGYSQGYRAGQTDRRYGRGDNYYNNSIYSSGTFGYQSYVARDQYQYYFQQGFQRGYQDGYRNSRQYGNGVSILGGILNTILQFSNP